MNAFTRHWGLDCLSFGSLLGFGFQRPIFVPDRAIGARLNPNANRALGAEVAAGLTLPKNR